jgi:hypothetical protein
LQFTGTVVLVLPFASSAPPSALAAGGPISVKARALLWVRIKYHKM